MIKRLIAVLALVCILCGVLCACESKEITAEEAVAVVLEDLDADIKNAGAPHVHTGTYQNETCYNIYITVNGHPLVYRVSIYGVILYKGVSEHSHE